MLRDDINNALKEAMKARDERRVSTLRLMNAAIKNADIEARGQGKEPLSDDELLVAVPEDDQAAPGIDRALRQGRPRPSSPSRSAPRSRSSPPTCRSRCRTPRPRPAIAAAITETGAASMKDMGKVMAR